ncbi:MAG: hypothetical protein SNH73_06655, partial [Rikenellaceae bacterium]
MNRFLILVSMLLVASSCSKEPSGEIEAPSAGNSISLAAQLPNVETRLGSSTDSDEGWSFSWENGDAMGNWHTGCTTLQKFTNNKATGEVASFSGDLGEGEYHRFIYPYEEDATVDGTIYSIDISSQDGALDNTFFVTQEIYTRTQLKDGSITTLPMEHVGGFIAVNAYLENYVDGYTYTLKKVEYKGLPVTAKIHLEESYDSEALHEVAEEDYGTITATLAEPFAAATYNGVDYLKATAKLNVIPFEVAQNEELTVGLTVEINTGTITEEITSYITSANNSGEVQSFARATHNFTNLKVDASYGITITGATINGWGEEVERGDLTLEDGCSYVEFKKSESNSANMTKMDDTGAI